jgi:hypothetical protein
VLTIAIFNLVRYRYANRPNPKPVAGRGNNFIASLLSGERFGERSKLYFTLTENRYTSPQN